MLPDRKKGTRQLCNGQQSDLSGRVRKNAPVRLANEQGWWERIARDRYRVPASVTAFRGPRARHARVSACYFTQLRTPIG